MIIAPPATTDYGFYNNYVFKVTDKDLITALTETLADIKVFVAGLTEDELNLRYDTGKWSIKEILLHLADSERTFCYRILRISRNDKSPLPGFDPHDFIMNAHAGTRSINGIMRELELLRKATIILYEEMHPEMLERTGPARDITMSVRALGFAIVGHVIHHINILNERYLPMIKK